MMLSIDARPIPVDIAAQVGDDLAFTVALTDMTSGAVTGVGATIVATVGGTAMTVGTSTVGLFVCSLTDAQTTSLGAGSHAFVFKLTPAGGDTRTYVVGTVTLSTGSTSVGGAIGYALGVCGNVVVAVAD